MLFAKSLVSTISLALLTAATPTFYERATNPSFALQNGHLAQALNAQFASLDASSPCQSGQNACVNGAFAQCVNGAFVSTPCAGGLTCVALPLVNSPGTSITCDTEADAETRIANTGAAGGLQGRSLEARATSSFAKSNGQAAQKLNAKFAHLTAGSSCTAGENACVGGKFAQCVSGKFVLTPCAGGEQCFALPLVNSPGTSITCDVEADAVARIANTGATGGLSGKRSLLEVRATAPPACEKSKRSNFSKRNSAGSIAKRIAQSDLPAVAQSWQDLCLKSGGDITTNDPCVTLAGDNGINALLANADPCAQQVNADAMIDFAKSKGVTNKQALIDNAIAYAKHPRNALNINGVVPSTPFCQNAPKNPELKGVTHAQLDGVDPGLFGSPALGVFAFGEAGTCPFGKTPDVNTCACN